MNWGKVIVFLLFFQTKAKWSWWSCFCGYSLTCNNISWWWFSSFCHLPSYLHPCFLHFVLGLLFVEQTNIHWSEVSFLPSYLFLLLLLVVVCVFVHVIVFFHHNFLFVVVCMFFFLGCHCYSCSPLSLHPFSLHATFKTITCPYKLWFSMTSMSAM